MAQANYLHYVASKGGARMLTKAMELVGYGNRVHAHGGNPSNQETTR